MPDNQITTKRLNRIGLVALIIWVAGVAGLLKIQTTLKAQHHFAVAAAINIVIAAFSLLVAYALIRLRYGEYRNAPRWIHRLMCVASLVYAAAMIPIMTSCEILSTAHEHGLYIPPAILRLVFP